MTFLSLIRRNLWYHRRAVAGVFAGVVITTAVITGALLVGDSVRHSLAAASAERLGNVGGAIICGDRFVRHALAANIGARYTGDTAAVVHVTGIATAPDRDTRVPAIEIFGVDEAFWEFGNASLIRRIAPEQIVLNTRLAGRLGVEKGDTVLLQMEQPSFLSRDAALVSVERPYVTLRLSVAAVIDGAGFGNFSLRNSQLAPYNAFVSRAVLQQAIGREGLVNLVLTEHEQIPDIALVNAWAPADAGLAVHDGVDMAHRSELRSRRVFFDRATAAAAAAQPGAARVLTYFVNELRIGDRATPYSMVSALDPALLPVADLRDDEIILNQWCADDLGAQVGDALSLKFYVLDRGRQLTSREANFIVRQVIPTVGAGIDRSLMPDFPGLGVAENCRDWDTGTPVDLDRIRDKDEKYWDDHRGSPKALITWQRGSRIWDNRFGTVTAVRYPQSSNAAGNLAAAVLADLDPAALGLQSTAVRGQARDAVTLGMDFGGLFIGFSFFLIIAAVLLTVLMFVFHLDQRLVEQGTLAALGFGRRRIGFIYLGEAVLLCTPAAICGAVLGALYTKVMIHGLGTTWRDVVGDWSLHMHGEPRTYLIGALSGIAVSLAAIWLVLRRQMRATVVRRLGGGAAAVVQRRCMWPAVITLATGLPVLLLLTAVDTAGSAPAVFFGIGALLLVSTLAACAWCIGWLDRHTMVTGPRAIGCRNVGRRSARSLAVIGMLACATFLIVALESQRTQPQVWSDRSSGTGGFAVFASTTHPLYVDPNGEEARCDLGLDEPPFDRVQFVPMRLVDGDDASCLNLNRAIQPQITGVDVEALARRNAFTFQKTSAPPGATPWDMLRYQPGANAAPAALDYNTMMYSLKLKLGDTLTYVDDFGEPFTFHIVAALRPGMLQGMLLADATALEARFPASAGFRVFLADAVKPTDTDAIDAAALATAMNQRFRDFGMDAVPAATRLAAFNRVQDTYLSIFQVLGGIGVVLGAFGLAILVQRNVAERRPELALMRALGFPVAALRRLVLAEHWVLLAAGLACGVVSALVAVLPTFSDSRADPPWAALALVLGGVLLSGIISTRLAIWRALQGDLISGLRRE